MSDEYLGISYPYRNGDLAELKEQHLEAFEDDSQFEVSFSFVETNIGSFEIGGTKVAEMTGMSHLENYKYKNEGAEWDLVSAPMVEYYLGTLAGLTAESSAEDRHPLDTLIDVVITGYEATDTPPLACVATMPHHEYYYGEAQRPPFTAESLAHDTYDHLSWLSIFTPSMVEHYGRETLLSAPAWQIRELVDGAILIVCHDDTVDWQEDCRSTAEHIGLPWYQDIE
jgi:hypothetical protein